MNLDDIKFKIKQFLNIEDLQQFCKLNKDNYLFCKNNKENICKHLLNMYKVNYTDPTNFIYIYNNTNQNKYKINDNWKYSSLFKLYMKQYYSKKINLNFDEDSDSDSDEEQSKITSIPNYPNLQKLDCTNHLLKNLPNLMVNLRILKCSNNKLTSIPSTLVNLKTLDCDNNKLTSIPSELVKLDTLHC